MGDSDWTGDSFTITLPPGAGPNDPAIVIGTEIPPELVAYYAAEAFPATVIGVFIFRRNAAEYVYMGLIINTLNELFLAIGRYDTGTVCEIIRYSGNTAFDLVQIGARLNAPPWAVTGTEFILAGSGATLDVRSLATLWMRSAFLTIETQTVVDVDSTCTVAIAPLRPTSDTQNTTSTTASLSYVNLTNIAGLFFTAPLSGEVVIHCSALVSNNTLNDGAALSPRIGLGGTVGAGALVLAASDTNSIQIDNGPAGANVRGHTHLHLTGLTPATVYNVSMQGRAVTGGTASFLRIHTTVVPCP